MRLADVAPRLARARDQYVAEQAQRAEQRRRLRATSLRLMWLVGHREMQLLRAMATGRRGYIRDRDRKLAASRRELARVERRLAELA